MKVKKVKKVNNRQIKSNKKRLPFVFDSKLKLTGIIASSLVVIILVLSLITGKNLVVLGAKKILYKLGVYTEEVKKVEIQSNDYDNPGSWHIDKSAAWTGPGKVQVTFDLKSVIKTDDRKKDVILVLDISESMAGEKLNRVINNSKELVNRLFENEGNRVSIITFDTSSTILTGFSNDKNDLLEKLDSITVHGNTNYDAALKNVEVVMDGYEEKPKTDVVTLFLTDGYPNESIPNQIGTYTTLKETYPYMAINGVQYEMGASLINEIKQISDNQWIADQSNLNNVLVEAILSPVSYENFVVTDLIDDDYFDISSIDDIYVSKGEVALDGNKVTWNLGTNAYATGTDEVMTINLTLKNQYLGHEGFYPTNKSEKVEYNFKDENTQTVNSTNTPVLKHVYDVIYDVNAPSGCNLEDVSDEKHYVYENVTKKTTELSCEGYLFKGWDIDTEDDRDIKKINEDVFVMPEHDVTIRGVWAKQDIAKTMDGTVHEKTTLYKVLENEATSGGLAKEYTGEHQDSMSGVGDKKIYHWYAKNDSEGNQIPNKNNVIFGDHCWQMIRTTDTGGVKLLYNGEVENGKCLNTRGTHMGYSGTSSINFDRYSSYWYGTDYTYDNASKKFKLSGEMVRTSSTNLGPDYIGKYTCQSTSADGTCSTLYMIYNSTIGSNSVSVVLIGSNAIYSTIGGLPFNVWSSTPASAGYMYGDTPSYGNINFNSRQAFAKTQALLSTTTFQSTWLYSKEVSFDGSTYTLVNPILGSDIPDNDYGEYYTFRSATITTSSSIYYLVAKYIENTYYYVRLDATNQLTNYNMMIGSSITNNGDGTYTIDDAVSVNLFDWIDNYASYANKYACVGISATCEMPRYITETSVTNYIYLVANEKIMIAKNRDGLTLMDTLLVDKVEWYNNYANYGDYKYTCNDESNICTDAALRLITSYDSTGYRFIKNYYFANSVTWDGNNYTLHDTLGIEDYNDINNIATHHYVCLNNSTVCDKVAYVYSSSDYYYYVLLENGVTTISKLMENMFTKNTYNSLTKSGIDSWYKSNMLDYDDYIEDTIFCNNRSIKNYAGWNDNGGMINESLFFAESVSTNNLSCTNVTDRFSVSNPSAQLTYKVGLMSKPEAELLGNINARKSGSNFRLISPFAFGSSRYQYGASINGVKANGDLDTVLLEYATHSMRPVISLIPEIEYNSGNGSMDDPYVVDLNG